jgi:formyltetrahydrofolate deformylase
MNHIVHIACSDAKGLVANITSILFKHGVNIEEMREYVDRQLSNFFMRLELSGEINHDVIQQELLSSLPANASLKISLKEPKNIIVLATKEYHCLSELLLKHHFGELNASIKCVIANHENLGDLTSKFGIPFFYVNHHNKSKEVFEKEIMEIVKAHSPDYLVLAKFMRILSPEFVSSFSDKIVNIHHSFLPAFVGANPYRQAFERGVKMIGATAHFVNNNLDEGPIITQKIVPVDHSFTVESMISAGHDVERQTLIDALKLVFDDRVFVEGNKTVVFA